MITSNITAQRKYLTRSLLPLKPSACKCSGLNNEEPSQASNSTLMSSTFYFILLLLVPTQSLARLLYFD